MSFKNELLEILNTPKFYYKGMAMNAFFLPVWDDKYSNRTIKNNIYNLAKDGYLEKLDGTIKISKKGQAFLEKNNKQKLRNFETIENNGPKNLLLLYDIPENEKYKRDWFRHTLIKFSFVMIQRIVCVGPSPLSKEFMNYVKSIGLKDSIKTFKLEKGYNIKD